MTKTKDSILLVVITASTEKKKKHIYTSKNGNFLENQDKTAT